MSVPHPETAAAPQEIPRSAGSRSTADLDPRLVAATGRRIRGLLREMAELAETAAAPDVVFEGLLTRTVQALGASGGGLWLASPDPSGELRLQHQVGWAATPMAADPTADAAHRALLGRVLSDGQSALIPPRSGGGGAENPCEQLLVVGLIPGDERPRGALEILQRPGAGALSQGGYLRFVAQAAELAARFLDRQRLRLLAERQRQWERMEPCLRQLHQSLDPRATAYAIANEGRRALDCDRVSVAWRRSRGCEIAAVSGLDTLERRAEQVKRLAALSAAAIARGEALHYAAADPRPAELDPALRAYLVEAAPTWLAVYPLERSGPAAGRAPRGRWIGALVVEGFTPGDAGPPRDLAAWLAGHAGQALGNAWEHARAARRAWGGWLARPWGLVTGGRAGRCAAACAALAAIAALLSLGSAPLRLSASGTLTPTTRHEIFAQVDGTLAEILIPDDPLAIVEAGTVLARVENNPLRVEIRDLEGQRSQLGERIRNLNRALSEPMEAVQRLPIERDLAEAIELERSAASQLEIKAQQLEHLLIRAPARGRIANWKRRDELLRRPVLTGQNLLTIVDPQSAWELELEVPERSVAELWSAQQTTTELPVRFALASHPGRPFHGRIVEIDRRLEFRGEHGNTLRVRVAFDRRQLPDELLKAGTRVSAQIECGRRPLGAVWFGELIDAARAAWWMWF